ncbi:MAG: hypothetical protein IPP17_26815 [Bacteroidetes bacterium]|nr:hypothetical protein [Bacteroidota bacterium]
MAGLHVAALDGLCSQLPELRHEWQLLFGGYCLGEWGFAREKCDTDFGDVVVNRMAAWSLYDFWQS